MTAPTPDEITAALAVLRAVPGVTEAHSLKGIAQIASPYEQLAREICSRWQDDPPHSDRAWVELAEAAHRHGLCITTDPGELVGYTSVYPPALAEGWEHDEVHVWGRNELDAAREFATARTPQGQRLAAVHLLPEGAEQ